MFYYSVVVDLLQLPGVAEVRSLESAQGQTSAQQGSQKLVAAQLSEMGSTEDRELENTDSERHAWGV